MNNEIKSLLCGKRMSRVKRGLRSLLLAVLCPMMAYADGDVGVKATVREGTTLRESAQFRLSKTPQKEIERAEAIREEYYKSKKQK